MKLNAMKRLERVARDVLQMTTDTMAQKAWPETFEWAHQVLAEMKLPVHQGSRPALILELLNAVDAPPKGYTVAELSQRTGIANRE